MSSHITERLFFLTDQLHCLTHNYFFDIIFLLFLEMEVDEEVDLLDEHYREGVDVAILITTFRNDPIPENICPFTGKLYTNWLMNSASDNAFYIVARMHKDISFIPLINLLRDRGELKDTRKVGATEKVFIFLHILCANTMRSVKARWQHSLSTISKCVHQVIDSILKVCHLLMEKPSSDDYLHPTIEGNPKFGATVLVQLMDP